MSGQKAPLAEALEVLLRFGTLMLRAGDTAFRVRDSMGMVATSMGIEGLSLHITINGMTATVRRNGRFVVESHEVTYCPHCQTGDKVLADRRMSRLVK